MKLFNKIAAAKPVVVLSDGITTIPQVIGRCVSPQQIMQIHT